QHAGPAVGAVALADDRVLARQHAVVVRRGLVEEGAVGHQALRHRAHLLRVAGPARDRRRAQVARVDEAHEVEALIEQRRVAALGVGGRLPDLRPLRRDVGLALRLLVAGRARAAAGPRAGVAAVAVRAAEAHRRRAVHGALI